METLSTRPWGNFIILYSNPLYQIKQLTVLPLQRLSLQSHLFRSEHWICISGSGIAEINDEYTILQKDIQVFINIGDKHRLTNTSSTLNLVIIEIQTGSSFDENDIIRYQDDYNRIK